MYLLLIGGSVKNSCAVFKAAPIYGHMQNWSFFNKQRSIKIIKKDRKTYTYLFLQVISYGSKKKEIRKFLRKYFQQVLYSTTK